MRNHSPSRFLIIDGYSKSSRDALQQAGMKLAWQLYANMLLRYQTDAEYDVYLPSDENSDVPGDSRLGTYHGILWTGCNLSVNDTDNPSVLNQIDLAKRAYEIGIPSWGSCWGLQIAVVAAGGRVEVNPKGCEMGLARKVQLTADALGHPMFKGKPTVFDAYISHDDMVTVMPEGGVVMAGNDFTPIQAAEVRYKKGIFWATQYHPEYDLNEMASLMVAREEKLTRIGYFSGHEDFIDFINRLRQLHKAPHRKDLRWQLAIDDDVLDENIRCCEFKNWLSQLVCPTEE